MKPVVVTPLPLWTTRSGRWLGFGERVPAQAWLALQALALWPHWRWAGARLSDGSDDPLGLVALLVLVVAVWRLGSRLRASPAPGWGRAAIALTLAATAAHAAAAPALVAALLAALAMAALLFAFLPSGVPRLPLAGLAVLALPVVSSLQFYAGFPLRVATAQLSAWLLQSAGMQALREGTALSVEGRLVIVDAPCSGVQMAWMAYFCACAVGWWSALPDGAFARRLAGVGAIVLAGNVVRNSILIGLEARGAGAAPGWHDALGLAVLAAVCAVVAALVHGGRDGPR